MSKFNLAEAIPNLVSKMDTGEIRELPIDKIDKNPKNFFEIESDITDLKESIQLTGLLQPLVVMPAEDGRYRLIAGHRRLTAIRALEKEDPEKWRTAPCRITHPSSPEMEELMLIQTNTESREIGWSEKNTAAERVEKILVSLKKQGVELPGKMRSLVAQIIKTSESQIARAKFISNHLIEPLRSDKISDSTAYELAHLPEDQQEELYKHYRKDLSDLWHHTIHEYQDNIKAGRDHFFHKQEKYIRTCYKQDLNEDREYPKCDRTEIMQKRKDNKELKPWEKCTGDCCVSCDYRYDCPDVCPHLKVEMDKSMNVASFRIGQRTKAARLCAGLDIGQAAAKLHIKPRYLLSHECGYLNLADIMPACEAYGCTPDELFGFSEQSDTPKVSADGWYDFPDEEPKDGQLCSLLIDNDIKIGGKPFVSLSAGRWISGRFLGLVNNMPVNRKIVSWTPMQEVPDKYTAALGEIDDDEDGDAVGC